MSKRSLLHVPLVALSYPYLQSMSSRGISYYRIPVGCPVAASSPGMQAKQERLLLRTRDSLMKSLDGVWIGRVSETLLLDLSLKILAINLRKIGFLV